jgi:hypothetical protein
MEQMNRDARVDSAPYTGDQARLLHTLLECGCVHKFLLTSKLNGSLAERYGQALPLTA